MKMIKLTNYYKDDEWKFYMVNPAMIVGMRPFGTGTIIYTVDTRFSIEAGETIEEILSLIEQPDWETTTC